MLEVQSALIKSINNSTVNEFRMPRPTMEPQQNHPIATFNLQNQYELQNNHQSLRLRKHLQTNLNIGQGEKHNEPSLLFDFSKKILYVGNLSPVVAEEDFYKLFGFKITSHLQKTCKAELFVRPKMGNCKCFAYVTVPYHIYKEIVKLNSVVFKSKPIKIEDAKIKAISRSQQYKISGNGSNAIMHSKIDSKGN